MKKWMFAVPLVGVVVLIHVLHAPAAPGEPDAVRRLPAKSRVAGGRSSRPRIAEVIRMGPEEWRARFEMEAGGRDPGTAEDIASLSGGLQELLEQGADPRGEDARIYAEAILALLDCRAIP